MKSLRPYLYLTIALTGMAIYVQVCSLLVDLVTWKLISVDTMLKTAPWLAPGTHSKDVLDTLFTLFGAAVFVGIIYSLVVLLLFRNSLRLPSIILLGVTIYLLPAIGFPLLHFMISRQALKTEFKHDPDQMA